MKLRDLFNLITQEFDLIAKECKAITGVDEYAVEDKRYEHKTKMFRSVQAFIKQMGGVLVGSGCYSYAYKLSLPWGDVVIKVANSRCNYVTRRDLDSNPALREHYLRPLFASKHCMIQPLCQPATEASYESARQWSDELEEKLKTGSRSKWHYDCHAGNIGHWRGKLVIFDAQPEPI